jgi:hypothetical protein
MYLYTTVEVISHVFVYYGSSERSCISLLRSSDQSCIFILLFKWSVMYLYIMVQVSGHVLEYYGSSDPDHLTHRIQIYDRSLEP